MRITNYRMGSWISINVLCEKLNLFKSHRSKQNVDIPFFSTFCDLRIIQPDQKIHNNVVNSAKHYINNSDSLQID